MDRDAWPIAGTGRWFCLTLATKAAAPALFEAFGGQWQQASVLTPRAVDALREGLPERVAAPIVRVADVDGGSLAFEDGSAQGTRLEVLRRASLGGSAVAVSLAPTDVPRLRWAEDGRVIAEVVLNAPDRVTGLAAQRLRALLGDARWSARTAGYDHRAVLGVGIELAAELAGLPVTARLLAQPMRGGLVLPVLDDPATADDPAEVASLMPLLRAADEQTVTRARFRQIDRVIEDWDLDAFPAVRQFAQAVRSEGPDAVGDAAPLGLLLRTLSSPLHWHTVRQPGRDEPVEDPHQLVRALSALRAAMLTPPAPALTTLLRARARASGNPLGDLRDDLDGPLVTAAELHADQQERRARAQRRAQVVEAARNFAGPLPTRGGAEAAWDWILSYLPHGLCLTFAEVLQLAELLTRMTGDPADATPAEPPWPPPIPTRDTRAATPFAAVGSTAAWAFAIEQGSNVGAQPDVLARVSAGTRAVNLRHEAYATIRFCYAEDGIAITEFSPLFPNQRSGADPDRFDEHLRALGLTGPVGAEDVPAAIEGMYLLATRALGIHIDPAAARIELIGTLAWQPTPPPRHGAAQQSFPATTTGGLQWWAKPGDPERPILHAVRPQGTTPTAVRMPPARSASRRAATQSPPPPDDRG